MGFPKQSNQQELQLITSLRELQTRKEDPQIERLGE